MCSKSCRLWDSVEKYGRAEEATDDKIIRRMRFQCWINKATETHSEYSIRIAFHVKNGLANAPQYCVTRTLPAALELWRVFSKCSLSHYVKEYIMEHCIRLLVSCLNVSNKFRLNSLLKTQRTMKGFWMNLLNFMSRETQNKITEFPKCWLT